MITFEAFKELSSFSFFLDSQVKKIRGKALIIVWLWICLVLITPLLLLLDLTFGVIKLMSKYFDNEFKKQDTKKTKKKRK